ncbi:hypothetical protein JL722_8583 [Aureococcus anophagefferens]|nr:hypothetical protein JL722_8583 [Aureococcus anophagefferens]
MHRSQLFALLATASAFAPPRGHAALTRSAPSPQRTTRRSMDEDATYEAPSDSTTIDDVIDVEQGADDRDADAQARAAHQDERVRARPGQERLFRSSPFWMAGRATCKDGKEAERYDWFCEMHRKATMVSEIGAVRQIISEDALVSEFETTVAALPMRVGGAMPLNVLGSIVSTASIEGVGSAADGSLELELLMGDVEVKGSNLPGIRQALDAGAKLDSRALSDALPIDTPRPVFACTYADDEIRISRDGDRNLYVRVKESGDTTPTGATTSPRTSGSPRSSPACSTRSRRP